MSNTRLGLRLVLQIAIDAFGTLRTTRSRSDWDRGSARTLSGSGGDRP